MRHDLTLNEPAIQGREPGKYKQKNKQTNKKTTVGYPLTAVKMAIIKKRRRTKLELSCSLTSDNTANLQ